MDEPMLRAWMTESVKPASHHDTLPGRWIAEPLWPPPGITPRRLFLTDEGLREATAPLAARAVCSPQTVGTCAGEWVPFGRGRDQAGDQQEDDVRSLVFETTPLDEPIEILGAPIVTLDVASDRPIANLVVRLCDVHPSGESLRVSYGVLNLTHRDGHEKKSGSRRSCGCHPRATPSCYREVCAPGRARTKCVIATGIALFLEISYDRSLTIKNRERGQRHDERHQR